MRKQRLVEQAPHARVQVRTQLDDLSFTSLSASFNRSLVRSSFACTLSVLPLTARTMVRKMVSRDRMIVQKQATTGQGCE